MSASEFKPAEAHLPPHPKRLHVCNIAGFTAMALLSVNLLEPIWGIEPRWSSFPYTSAGFVLYLARSMYEWWFTRPPFGPYAEPTRRSKLIVVLVALAVFAAVLTPAATA